MQSANWNKIFRDLQNRGETIRSISKHIGTNFRNQVYMGYRMSDKSFQKLQILYGSQIETCDKEEKFTVKESEDFAELIGIILGDGHLSKNGIVITLGTKEQAYSEYVSTLLCEVIQLDVHRRQGDVIRLIINSRKLSRYLYAMGLRSHKVKNQVSVPEWIYSSRRYITRCVKGLTDTDGSVYYRTNKGRRYLSVSFSNRSEPLLQFFREFCLSNGIRCSRSGHAELVQGISSVDKFLRMVNPEKGRLIEEI